MSLNAADLKNLANEYSAVAKAIADWNASHPITDEAQQTQIDDLVSDLVEKSGNLMIAAVTEAMATMAVTVANLKNATQQAQHALNVINDVTKIIGIGGALIGLGAAILDPTPAGIVGAANGVIQAVKQALAPAAGGVAPPPKLTSITPASGPAAGGTSVTITGTDFTNGATVNMGSAPATAVKWISKTSISATTPAQAAGSVDVAVINADGQLAILASGYQYV